LKSAKSIPLIVNALFRLVNPIGGNPVFLPLTQEYATQERKLRAGRVAINSFILLIVSFVVGTHILWFVGISLPVVQVGGGLIVVSTGWPMLTRSDPGAGGDRGQMHQSVDVNQLFQKAFYPLTLTVGAGSISIVTLGANEPRHLGANVLAILSAAIASALSVHLCYGYADRLAAAVVPSGINVILRLSAFFADVHRHADFVERSECAGAYAPPLGRALSLAGALFMERNRWCQSRTRAPACIIEIECMRTAILPH
jgi:multiple antibiotic resistance protein